MKSQFRMEAKGGDLPYSDFTTESLAL